MPILIKNIQGSVITPNSGDIYLFHSVTGEFQEEDYVNLSRFTAYLQNLTQVEFTEALVKPLAFGLKNSYNKQTIELDINY